MELIRRLLKFNHYFVVESIGRRGDLTLFWKQEIDIQIQSYSKWHINAIFQDNYYHHFVLLTGFYGHPKTSKREYSWNLLRTVAPLNNQLGFVLMTSIRLLANKKDVV